MPFLPMSSGFFCFVILTLELSLGYFSWFGSIKPNKCFPGWSCIVDLWSLSQIQQTELLTPRADKTWASGPGHPAAAAATAAGSDS